MRRILTWAKQLTLLGTFLIGKLAGPAALGPFYPANTIAVRQVIALVVLCRRCGSLRRPTGWSVRDLLL